MVTQQDRDQLQERLHVWSGPLERDIAACPDYLTDLAHKHGAGTVVIDSLKDVALDLETGETGSRVNAAFQRMLAAGVEVAALHHQRKGQVGAAKPKTLADVYGSVWITAGAGSVLLLWGEPGDPVVTLSTLKPAIGEIGPMRVAHNHASGQTHIRDGANLEDALRLSPSDGLTAKAAATILYDNPEPTDAEIERARYRLDRLVNTGHAHRGEDIPITYTWLSQKPAQTRVGKGSERSETPKAQRQTRSDSHATKRSEHWQTSQTLQGAEGSDPLKGAALPKAQNRPFATKTPDAQKDGGETVDVEDTE